MLNKIIKALGAFGIHVLVALEVYLLALFLLSPVFCLALGIMDLCSFPLTLLQGKILFAFLAIGGIIWVFLYIYVKVKVLKKKD